MNILCDQRAKEIIRKEIKSKIPFPFKLSSFFISLTTSNLIVNMKEDLWFIISMKRSENYLFKKLMSIVRLNKLNWKSRKKAIELISALLKIWYSKSLMNFAETSHRL